MRGASWRNVRPRYQKASAARVSTNESLADCYCVHWAVGREHVASVKKALVATRAA